MKNFEKHRKRLVCLLLTLSMLGASACGTNGAEQTASGAASATSETAEVQPEETAAAETEEAQPEETTEAEEVPPEASEASEAEEVQPEASEEPTATPTPTPTPSAEPQPEKTVAAETPAVYGTTAYTLTETATFEMPASCDLVFQDGKLMLKENGTYRMLSRTGAQNNSTKYVYASGLGSASADAVGIVGYLEVKASDTDDVNCLGLVNPDGEELISCEAANIVALSSRFLEVTYTTETCTKDDPYVYVKDNQYYKGSRKIYDLQKERFIDNINAANGTWNYDSAGTTMVSVYDADSELFTVYDENGSVVRQMEAQPSVCGEVFEFRETPEDQIHSVSYVYDINGERFHSDDYLSVWDGYIMETVDSGYLLLDMNGNQLLSEAYFDIEDYQNGTAAVKTDKGKNYQLIDVSSGNVLYEGSDLPQYISDGFWYAGNTLIGPGGLEKHSYTNNLYNLCPNDNNHNYLILNTGEDVKLDSSTYPLRYGMVETQNDTGKYAAFDLFTGKALTDYAYTDMECGCGYLYAVENNTCHVFEVTKTQ